MTINKPNNSDSQAKKFKLAPDFAGTESRVVHDLEKATELALLFDKERGITENPLFGSSDWKSFSVCLFYLPIHLILKHTQPKEQLDRAIYYLRMVHVYCYYCAEQFEDQDDIRRRCGTIHLRSKNKKKDSADYTPSDKGFLFLPSLLHHL